MSSTQEVGQIFGEGSGPATAMLRSPTVIIASVGLWGMNVYFFRLFGIDYVHVLNLDLVKEREAAQQLASNGAATGGVGNGMPNPSTGGSAHESVENGTAGVGATNGGVGGKAVGDVSDKQSDIAAEDILDESLSDAVITDMEIPKTSPPGPAQEIFRVRHHSNSESENGHEWKENGNEDDDVCDAAKLKDATGIAHSGNTITSAKLLGFSVFLLILLHLTTYVWINLMGGGSIGAVFSFYGAVFLGIVVPFPSTRWLRSACITVLQRAFELVNPRCAWVVNEAPRPIPFIDVFFADAMCSLSKVFFDWGVLWHMAAHYPHPIPAATHNILIPSFCAAVPYLIRARQCLIMHTVGKLKNDPKRYQHILNAIKYSTSIFPLCLSAYQKTISKEQAEGLENFLLVLLTINALYALAWDVVMDWGMMQNPTAALGTACAGAPDATKPATCGHLLRPRLRFGVLMSTVILVADAVLRFSWLLRFYESALFPSKDAFVLCTQFLEVFRRAIWNLLRVEWENIKQMKAKRIAKGRSFDDEEENAPFISPAKSVQMIPTRSTSNTW